MKKISILGSTGSIGVSTLDVCRQHPEKFEIVGLAAGKQTQILLEQIKEFKPNLVSVYSLTELNILKPLLPSGVEIQCGVEGAQNVASLTEADLVVSAIVGAAGLLPTLKAIECGKEIALANKESMVIAGEVMSKKAEEHGVKILPVDSEHSAIFQCLNGESIADVDYLKLTASGGPFLKTPLSDFKNITKQQALKHPNWEMGAKITIDSASMMNKGLEVIEACWLFQMPVEKVKVVVHPQSIIHSMVEFVDGSVMAQLGEPDMKVPIAYALSFPRRISTKVKRLNLTTHGQLTFFAPDLNKFRCLAMALDVARLGKSYAPVINAANEIAVASFLADKIGFAQISNVIDDTLQKHKVFELASLEDVLEADRWARECAQDYIGANSMSSNKKVVYS
ncbi:1-deoxy-D-xylulose-5-phosphate reductoisomerase [bacterium K02(2017)]|nr:1-deoxy-D-xylulose-5-phosphate reductoisomerase [bacterium K02(2017)]